MDWYVGIKPVTGRITWDLGVIYYSYPNAFNPGLNVNYFELKVGASGDDLEGRHRRCDGLLVSGLPVGVGFHLDV